jgi:N-acetylmuramoyl-L-alanine amidase
MLKKTLVLFTFLAGHLFLSSYISLSHKNPPVKTIIIDAGHGGKDQGADGLISTEAQVCLEVARKLGKQIERDMPGVKILFTRTTDVIPGNKTNKNDGNRYRADFANKSGADLFISIHCNSAGKSPGGWYEKKVVDWNEKVSYKGKGKKKKKVITRIPVYQPYYVVNEASGTETYIWTAKESEHKGQMVASEFSSEDDSTITIPENDPVLNALKLIYTKKYFGNSLRLADLVQQEFEKTGRINRGVKQRNEKGIWVLHATGMPSILIETGFISNKEEEKYLTSDAGQQEIVDDIAAAVKKYITQQEAAPASSIRKPLLNEGNKGSTAALLDFIENKEQQTKLK